MGKYLVSGGTMLLAIVVWLIVISLYESGFWPIDDPLWFGLGLCLVSGGLGIFSGVRCQRVTGGRIGYFVRAIVFALMAAYTYETISTTTAAILGLTAIVLLILGIVRLPALQPAPASKARTR